MLTIHLAMLAAVQAAGTGLSHAQAEVAWAHEARDRIVVEGSVWRCDGTSCRGSIADTPLLKHRACRAIARYAGGVTRFETATGELDAGALARCNGKR